LFIYLFYTFILYIYNMILIDATDFGVIRFPITSDFFSGEDLIFRTTLRFIYNDGLV